ncbi:prolyl 4-hydroxylase, alpha subunit [Pseudomonas sp. M47T1]|uniref:2OG-Fe(II) oxygenase n=1 Tax=Pseudomonas sp. M47T1 TaxID=1179778 RepID=UPI00026075F8|nr:2OG-Fe(II) oxygenase [Pseudomonas sp. M47T1]EIK94835.1 prolyl 4-hydroxylase, alpha subunit [Pseudomonas sp. M47T1]
MLATIGADALTPQLIQDLLAHRVYGIRIPGFVSQPSLEAARAQLFDHPERGALGHAREFTRLGIAYAEVKTDEVRQAYHEAARANIQRVRTAFKPYVSPIDEFRLCLDEAWPRGAHLLDVDGQKCFTGVCRYQAPDIDLCPHIDKLEWNLPAHLQVNLQAQLSVNIYLQVPPQGGELEVWDIRPTAAEYQWLKSDRHYGIDRDRLRPADFTTRPEDGDLIIINPRFIHAVRPVHASPRITLSSFIGYFGEQSPLIFWS